MNKIAVYLDVDGVLNQYNTNQRIYRKKKHGWGGIMNPFPKKILRLNKLIKKYNIDVYLFSAWTIDDLQPFLPFSIKEDTNKMAKNINRISKNYDFNLVIDDEISAIINRPEIKSYDIGRYKLDSNIKTYQPNLEFGLVKKDFRNLERILNDFN